MHTILSLLLWLYWLPVGLLRLLPHHLLLCGSTWQAGAARWAELLPLEPRAEASSVEDVPARQPLALADHLLATDDADAVNSLELSWGDVWVAGGRGRGQECHMITHRTQYMAGWWVGLTHC